jgi:hypothetical protein
VGQVVNLRRIANPPAPCLHELPRIRVSTHARAVPAGVQELGIVFTRFLWAMGTYAVLATLAAVTLDGKMRTAVWILLGGLAVKTVIAYKAPR